MKALLALLMVSLAMPAAALQQAQEAAPAASKLRKPDVGYEPTPQKKVRQMLELAGVKAGDVVYDLGSGDGRIPITAAREYGARGVGIELNPKLFERAQRNAREAGVTDRVAFRNQDLFQTDLSEASVVTLFLWPSINTKLRPKLMRELKPGTRVVSYFHDMDDWQPAKVIRGNHILGGHIYLWIIPEQQ